MIDCPVLQNQLKSKVQVEEEIIRHHPLLFVPMISAAAACICYVRNYGKHESGKTHGRQQLQLLTKVLKALGKPESELETLQKHYREKREKIQELYKQIKIAKLRLEQKKRKNKGIPDEKKEAFNELSQKYNSLREEYIALSRELN
ncbi:hypothetical protein GQ457_16G006810 [Hibiscus cannabinus]